MMTAPTQFLESLSNIGQTDYMHSRREVNPSFFLKRINWLTNRIPKLNEYLKNTNFVHITGTGGKGTVGTILQSIIAHQGFKVGFYNSPHVVTIYERMRIIKSNQSPYYISPQIFEHLLQSLKPYLEDTILHSPYGLLSYFEILVILSLLFFKKEKCHYIILEVGCGGRFDATNIIPQSDLAIITNIGYDHEHLIGPTLSHIAYEKAGIIKKNSQVLTGPTIKGRLLQIIKKEAAQKKSTVITIDQRNTTTLLNHFFKKTNRNYNQAIKQLSNELIAIKAAQILDIPPKAIHKGLKNFKLLPGRFEIIKKNPLIIFDGAHNCDKIKYLISRFLNSNFKFRKSSLVFGSVSSKNWRQMLKLLVPYFDKIYLTRHTVIQRKSADLKQMYNYTNKLTNRLNTKIFIDPLDALQQALTETKKGDLILATGSLYLIGTLKNFFKNNKQ